MTISTDLGEFASLPDASGSAPSPVLKGAIGSKPSPNGFAPLSPLAGNQKVEPQADLGEFADLPDSVGSSAPLGEFADVAQKSMPLAPVRYPREGGPASIRSNNPGAMWNNPIARAFGSKGAQKLNDGLGQGNEIALFDDPVNGAAAQISLLAKNYAGFNLGRAIAKWSGGNGVSDYLSLIRRDTGLTPNVKLTKDFLMSPQGLSLAKAMARHEAGLPYPLSDEQWRQAQAKAGQYLGVQPSNPFAGSMVGGDVSSDYTGTVNKSLQSPSAYTSSPGPATPPPGGPLDIVSRIAQGLPITDQIHSPSNQSATDQMSGLIAKTAGADPITAKSRKISRMRDLATGQGVSDAQQKAAADYLRTTPGTPEFDAYQAQLGQYNDMGNPNAVTPASEMPEVRTEKPGQGMLRRYSEAYARSKEGFTQVVSDAMNAANPVTYLAQAFPDNEYLQGINQVYQGVDKGIAGLANPYALPEFAQGAIENPLGTIKGMTLDPIMTALDPNSTGQQKGEAIAAVLALALGAKHGFEKGANLMGKVTAHDAVNPDLGPNLTTDPLRINDLRQNLAAGLRGEIQPSPVFDKNAPPEPDLLGRLTKSVQAHQPETLPPHVQAAIDAANVPKEPPKPADLDQLGNAMESIGMSPDKIAAAKIAVANVLRLGEETGKPLSLIQAVDKIDPTGKLSQAYTEPFYSKLEQVAQDKLPNRASADQVRNTLLSAGVKPEEMQWTGTNDFLDQNPTVDKSDLLDHLNEHRVELNEITKGDQTLGTQLAQVENRLSALHNQLSDALQTQEGYNFQEAEQYAYKVSHGNEEVQPTHIPSSVEPLVSEIRGLAAQRLDLMERGAWKTEDTKYSQYTLPGGENYREMLLQLPRDRSASSALNKWHKDHPGEPTPDSLIEAADKEQYQPTYQSSHWDEPNVLAHIRFDTRTGPNGEKILHVAEVQSDWHQAGRKEGYGADLRKRGFDIRKEPDGRYAIVYDRTGVNTMRDTFATPEEAQRHWDNGGFQNVNHVKGVPDAPFKKTWHELALKRILRYAAENGYDKVTWDTGATNAERYDLSKQVKSVEYYPADGRFRAYGHDASPVLDRSGIKPEQLEDFIGKEAAQKLLDSPAESVGDGRTVHGLYNADLKMGGEGMHGFYDKILPDAANKIGKRFGAKVEETTVPSAVRNVSPYAMDHNELAAELRTNEPAPTETAAHGIPIPPEMRQSLLHEGQPLFQKQMVGLHNTRLGGIEHAAEMGGIAQPSLAVVTEDVPFENFGNATFVAKRDMIDPRMDSRNALFDADVYSQRQPRPTHTILSREAGDKLRLWSKETGHQTYADPYNIGKFEGNKDRFERELRDDDAVQAKFLESLGFKVEPNDRDALREQTYQAQRNVPDYYDKKDRFIQNEFGKFSVNPQIKVNGKNMPYTLENVSDAMGTRARGRESTMTQGLGKQRAKLTKRFGSLDEAKGAQSNIVGQEEFAKYKEKQDSLWDDYSSVASSHSYRDLNGFIRFHVYDSLSDVIGDLAKGKPSAELLESRLRAKGFRPTDEQIQAGVELARLIKKSPTEYFESKLMRPVLNREWAGVVVPKDAPPETLNALNKSGIDDVRTYDPAIPGDRQRAVQSFKDRPDVFFQRNANMVKGSYSPEGRVIDLVKGRADLSTVLHEVGHYFHDVLIDHPEYGKYIRAQYGDLSNVEGAEAFSKQFERYFQEGKAPNSKLKTIFDAIKGWMAQIYGKLKKSSVSPIPRITRGIFDETVGKVTPEVQKLMDDFDAATKKEWVQAREYGEYGGGIVDKEDESPFESLIRHARETKAPEHVTRLLEDAYEHASSIHNPGVTPETIDKLAKSGMNPKRQANALRFLMAAEIERSDLVDRTIKVFKENPVHFPHDNLPTAAGDNVPPGDFTPAETKVRGDNGNRNTLDKVIEDQHRNEGQPKEKTKPSTKLPAKNLDSNTVFTREAMERAKEDLNKGSITSSLDPERIKNLAIIGGYYLEKGVRDFAEWSKVVASHVASATKDELKAAWDNLQPKETAKPAEDTPNEPTGLAHRYEDEERIARGGQPKPGMGTTLEKMALAGKELVNSGKIDPEAVIRENRPLTPQEITAVSYFKQQLANKVNGIVHELSQGNIDPVRATFLNGELDRHATTREQIDNAAQLSRGNWHQGGVALNTGFKPDYSLDEIRSTAKAKNNGQPIPESDTKAFDKNASEIVRLNKELTAARAEIEETLKGQGELLTDKKRSTLRNLVNRLTGGKWFKENTGGFASKKAGSIRFPNNGPSAVRAMQALAKDSVARGAKNLDDVLAYLRVGSHLSDEHILDMLSESYRQTRQHLTEDQIAVNNRYNSIRRAAEFREKPLMNKVGNVAVDGLNAITYGMKLSGHTTAPFVQGLKALYTHPDIWAKSWGQQVAGLAKGERGMTQQRARFVNDPIWKQAEPRLALTDIHGSPSEMEENMAQGIVNRIPGLGKVFEHSSSGFAMFMNQVRFDMFKRLARIAPDDPHYLDSIADHINTMTGRSTSKTAKGLASLTGPISFGPRYTVSKWEYSSLKPLRDAKTVQARQQIALSYGKVIAANVALIGLAKALGAGVGLNPEDKDFGKITLPGGTTIDLFTKEGEMYKVLAQALVGTSKNGKSGPPDFSKTVGDYLRGRSSPAIGSVIDLRRGNFGEEGHFTNPVFGQQSPNKPPFSWKEEAKNLLEPIVAQSALDAKARGVPGYLAGLNILGIGVRPGSKPSKSRSKGKGT